MLLRHLRCSPGIKLVQLKVYWILLSILIESLKSSIISLDVAEYSGTFPRAKKDLHKSALSCLKEVGRILIIDTNIWYLWNEIDCAMCKISLIEQHSGSWKNTVVIPFSVNFLHGKKPKIWRTLKKGQNLSRIKTWLFLCSETLVNILKQNECKPGLEAMIVV